MAAQADGVEKKTAPRQQRKPRKNPTFEPECTRNTSRFIHFNLNKRANKYMSSRANSHTSDALNFGEYQDDV